MENGKFHYPNLIFVSILASALVSLAGCTNTVAMVPSALPNVMELAPPPPILTIDQIYSVYSTDEAAADTVYRGKYFIFDEIEVEEVGFAPGGAKTYFENGNVRFQLRDQAIMQTIEPGYILNLEGQCLGFNITKDHIRIDVRWVESVKGDISGGVWIGY
jgi:hypothetical protein